MFRKVLEMSGLLDSCQQIDCSGCSNIFGQYRNIAKGQQTIPNRPYFVIDTKTIPIFAVVDLGLKWFPSRRESSSLRVGGSSSTPPFAATLPSIPTWKCSTTITCAESSERSHFSSSTQSATQSFDDSFTAFEELLQQGNPQKIKYFCMHFCNNLDWFF